MVKLNVSNVQPDFVAPVVGFLSSEGECQL
jgi:hypothetical protein